MEERLKGLVSWVEENLGRLRDAPATVVADQLGDEILRVDGRLGVEVADASSEDRREVLVTAFSDPALFPLVHRIAESLPDLPGWRFLPLKPPRGFAFKLTIGGHQVDARSLEFAPATGIDAGIQLIVSSAVFDALPAGQEAEELAWLVVETGIGEELSGRLQHIEFAVRDGTGDCLPVTQLADYVRKEWTS